jgi:hypothetical protein
MEDPNVLEDATPYSVLPEGAEALLRLSCSCLLCETLNIYKSLSKIRFDYCVFAHSNDIFIICSR